MGPWHTCRWSFFFWGWWIDFRSVTLPSVTFFTHSGMVKKSIAIKESMTKILLWNGWESEFKIIYFAVWIFKMHLSVTRIINIGNKTVDLTWQFLSFSVLLHPPLPLRKKSGVMYQVMLFILQTALLMTLLPIIHQF